MKPQLQSSLILLKNVFYESKKYTRETFTKKLEEEFLPSSKNAITDLLKFINDIFGIELSFKNKEGQICIKEEIDNKFHFVRTLLLNGQLRKNDIIQHNHVISFSSDSEFKNTHLIFDLITCIIKTQKIKITHQNFYGSPAYEVMLKPYLIKEYLGRWYLLAERESDSKLRVYGIDRIKDVEIYNYTFEPNLHAINVYKNTIGVSFNIEQGKAEKIILWVEAYQFKLFESYPIHTTQKTIEKHASYGVLQIEVVNNYELKQLLASYLLKVRVLEPESLRNEMLELFEAMKKRY
jgi:predicted DNA-binding transcriptional regulator YafY